MVNNELNLGARYHGTCLYPRVCFVMRAEMTDHEFNIEAMVRGYHIYQSVWDAAVDGKVLNCYREVGNTRNPYDSNFLGIYEILSCIFNETEIGE